MAQFPILSLLVVRQGSPVLLFLLCFSYYFWQLFVRRLRTSVLLGFCFLVLLGWSGMNISLFFRMRVWGFVPLCWPFLHTVSKLDYFWILGVLYPKAQWVLVLKFFQNLGILPHFSCRPNFSNFFGISLVVDLDHLFGCCSTFWCNFMFALGCMPHLYF